LGIRFSNLGNGILGNEILLIVWNTVFKIELGKWKFGNRWEYGFQIFKCGQWDFVNRLEYGFQNWIGEMKVWESLGIRFSDFQMWAMRFWESLGIRFSKLSWGNESLGIVGNTVFRFSMVSNEILLMLGIRFSNWIKTLQIWESWTYVKAWYEQLNLFNWLVESFNVSLILEFVKFDRRGFI